MVVDWSQTVAPRQITRYTIAATSTRLHIGWCEVFESLEDARRESLKKALDLPDAPKTDEEAKDQWRRFSPAALYR